MAFSPIARRLAPLFASWLPSLAAMAQHDPTAATTIAWQTDLVAARAQAAERRAPLLVVFRCER